MSVLAVCTPLVFVQQLVADDEALRGSGFAYDGITFRDGNGIPLPEISSGAAQAARIKSVPPVYPPAQRAAYIQGSVEIRVVIDKNGRVVGAEPLKGNGALAEAAAVAIRKWLYRPFLINGVAAQIQTEVTVNFRLARKRG